MKTVIAAVFATLLFGASAFATGTTNQSTPYEGGGCSGKGHTASLEQSKATA